MAKVLIVDDDDLLVALLQVKMAARGHEVFFASDGNQALAATREHRPDIIILDAVMPGRDGFAVLSALKEDAETAGIPVIMLTSRNHESDVMNAKRRGVSDYMAKPFSPDELFKRMQRALAAAAS